MTLLKYYQRKVASGEILEDPQQVLVLHRLQALYEALLPEKSFLKRLTHKPPKGLYLWGSVGIGKTFLMDTFYHFLPFEDKWRTHFLPFMREVHAQLQTLQGVKNPLLEIAKHWAKQTRIICFDEFAINDIADAMLLGGLLQAFFDCKICVIFTSNVSPDELYKNGIQRELFLPTIEEIKTHTEVIHLALSGDYRQHFSRHSEYYWSPLTKQAQENMQHAFAKFSEGSNISTAPLIILDREISIKKCTEKVVWFDFLTLCSPPRSKDDYLVIAEEFSTVLISNLYLIRPNEHDTARLFIQLIDVLYEAKTRLIISAALPIDQIYPEGKLEFEFERTRSRLTQMQSAEWGA